MEVSLNDVNCSVKFFRDLAQLICDAIGLVKSKNIWQAIKLIPDIERLVVDAKCALPELAHMNQQDAATVAGAAYQCVKKIVSCA
jgi:hypothetical protein